MSPALEKSRKGNADVVGECRDGGLKSRVTVVGSGNWGSVAAKLIASNALKLPSFHGNDFRVFRIFIESLLNMGILVCYHCGLDAVWFQSVSQNPDFSYLRIVP